MNKKKIKITIVSPARVGAGIQSKLISKHYNLLYLDKGKYTVYYLFIGLNIQIYLIYPMLKN